MKKTTISPGSEKQAARDAEWIAVCAQRRGKLKAKFGYLVDEWTGKRLPPNTRTQGHHNDRDRSNNTLDNCRILTIKSHEYVTDNNIRDVPDRLTEKPAAKSRTKDRPCFLSGYGHGFSLSKEQQVGKSA